MVFHAYLGLGDADVDVGANHGELVGHPHFHAESFPPTDSQSAALHPISQEPHAGFAVGPCAKTAPWGVVDAGRAETFGQRGSSHSEAVAPTMPAGIIAARAPMARVAARDSDVLRPSAPTLESLAGISGWRAPVHSRGFFLQDARAGDVPMPWQDRFVDVHPSDLAQFVPSAPSTQALGGAIRNASHSFGYSSVNGSMEREETETHCRDGVCTTVSQRTYPSVRSFGSVANASSGAVDDARRHSDSSEFMMLGQRPLQMSPYISGPKHAAAVRSPQRRSHQHTHETVRNCMTHVQAWFPQVFGTKVAPRRPRSSAEAVCSRSYTYADADGDRPERVNEVSTRCVDGQCRRITRDFTPASRPKVTGSASTSEVTSADAAAQETGPAIATAGL